MGNGRIVHSDGETDHLRLISNHPYRGIRSSLGFIVCVLDVSLASRMSEGIHGSPYRPGLDYSYEGFAPMEGVDSNVEAHMAVHHMVRGYVEAHMAVQQIDEFQTLSFYRSHVFPLRQVLAKLCVFGQDDLSLVSLCGSRRGPFRDGCITHLPMPCYDERQLNDWNTVMNRIQ